VTKWQRRARWALAIIAISVIAVVAYTMRPREPVAPRVEVKKSDPNAKIEIQQCDAVQLKGERQNIRVECDSQSVNQENETTLHGVKIHVDNRGGRSYVVTGKQAFIGKENTSFDVRGAVTLTTDDGLEAKSEQATYVDAEKMVRVPGAVTFKRGRMSGSGVGMSFDEQRDTLWILDKADVQFAADKDQEAMAFTSGTFGYARRDRYMRFEKTMHMEREGQVIDAESSLVRLFPDRDEPDYIELRNQARVTGSGNNSALKSMTARDINLDYADDGRTLQNATLAGNSEIQVANKGSAAAQKLAGEYMDIGLEPDGSVRSLSTRERVTVTLPATKDTAARTIRSNALTAAGSAQGIREMKFTEGVEYREPGPKGQGGKTVRARSLEAVLDPAAGTLQDAHFISGVDFTDAPLHATGSDARYNVAKGTLALSGKEPEPHIDSDDLTIDAVTIDVTLNPRTMTAKGNVRSVLLPAKKGDTAAKRPALLAEKDPVNILAESFTYDEAKRKADYSGTPGRQVLLMQGDTTIRASTMTIDEAKGDLVANGKVITNLIIAGAKKAEPETKTKPMVARAEMFTYSDQTRTATYTTTAQLDGEQGNLSAGKLELMLAKADNTLEKLEANGAVTAVVDKRTVTGTRLSYSTADDKYVVVGAPVKMIDAECQETSGKTLTFWKASDRVQVDGNNEVRTQTKGGGKCPATPPQ
jgi:LPS export ABC transporter protein LptC/lipopolysaccharide transport protein LptA